MTELGDWFTRVPIQIAETRVAPAPPTGGGPPRRSRQSRSAAPRRRRSGSPRSGARLRRSSCRTPPGGRRPARRAAGSTGAAARQPGGAAGCAQQVEAGEHKRNFSEEGVGVEHDGLRGEGGSRLGLGAGAVTDGIRRNFGPPLARAAAVKDRRGRKPESGARLNRAAPYADGAPEEWSPRGGCSGS